MDINRIFVLDTETSLHNKDVGKFLAHPQSTDNWVVWLGVQELDMNLEYIGVPELAKYESPLSFECHTGFDVRHTMLVGHNIGFDLLYMANPNNTFASEWIEYINNPHNVIWDTQIAEYRLSGQTQVSPALDAVCERRGWAMKPGRLKEYWENGISTEAIPDDEVIPYLTHDVTVTTELFRAQLMEAQAKGMLEMLQIEMRSRMTTLVMEHNGMQFDQDQARKDCAAVLKPLRQKAEEDATTKGMALFGLPRAAVKANSPHFLKAVLYGGEVKWKEQRPILDDMGNITYFKSGKKKGMPKMKWTDIVHVVPQAKGMSPVDLKITDDETLVKIIDHTRCSAGLADFLEDVRTFRDGQKQEKTYFTGYSDLTWPDGMIHGNLNHAITATGRLSSSNPNLQNAGHSPIRTHFKSRYEGGHLMEVDLSQIEVLVQAWLSQDENMLKDIVDGIDFHSKRAAFAHGVDYQEVKDAVDDVGHKDHKYWSKIRKGAKIVSFQKAYGAGVKKIASTTGLTPKEVKAFMDAEDANYPEVPKTQEFWIKEVDKSTGIRDGRTCGILKSPINVEYRFFQEALSTIGRGARHDSYKPTCIKNYPIQGFSADIIKIILADLRQVVDDYNILYKPSTSNATVRLVNTVHDSVILDLPKWVHHECLGKLLKNYFKHHPVHVLKDTFGVDFNAPISADVDVGVNWHEMETITC